MLYYKPVRPSLGYSTLPINIGSLSNAGVELELRGDVVKTKNVTWSLYANVSYNKNKILELDPTLGGEWISGSYIYREGEAMNQFYIREYAGVFDGDISKVPTTALTVGVGTVLDAKEVLVLAFGHKKANALKNAIEGAYSQSCTLSALQAHPHGIIVADELSVGELKVNTYRYFKDIEKDNL